jgi:hypothetical protein
MPKTQKFAFFVMNDAQQLTKEIVGKPFFLSLFVHLISESLCPENENENKALYSRISLNGLAWARVKRRRRAGEGGGEILSNLFVLSCIGNDIR